MLVRENLGFCKFCNSNTNYNLKKVKLNRYFKSILTALVQWAVLTTDQENNS